MNLLRQRIEELFDAALELPPRERAGWLAEVCAEQPELLGAVSHLLRAHERASGILEDNAGDLAHALAPQDTGRTVGGFRIIRELGRGGMGVVYLAVREDGHFRQRVALKLLRGSPDAHELQQRFRAERQILASLQHPGIAQLIDGGITDGHLPYLVMEYVEGVPITTYCDRHGLGVDARLRLFQDVCHAVQHAHKNLVLHRDLKPGNILVTDAGQVKLLDFGIAKLLNPALSGLDLPITRTELRVLTPEYASPEQIRGEVLSTASDVYSLGVVLYELLTGEPPYKLLTRSPHELATLVCEREVDRPSVCVSRQGDEAAAAARASSRVRLTRYLRGDLDAIALMALRKEATRRYASAEQFAQDIERSLQGRPVHAQRGSRRYRAAKFLRRHRVMALAGVVVGASLLGGAGLALWQAGVARAQRDRAEAALLEAEQALRQSEQVTGFLTSLFDANNPGSAGGGEVTARELLRRGIRRADELDGQPIVQAAMFDAIGRVQQSLGQFAEARLLLERALALRQQHRGEEHPDVAATLYNLAELLRRQGLFPEAEARARRALEIRQRVRGPEHSEVAASLLQISFLLVYPGDLRGAVAFARQAAAMYERSAGPADPATTRSLTALGDILRRLGEYEEAEQVFRSALERSRHALGPGHLETSDPMAHLAYLLQDQPGRVHEADSLIRAAMELRRRVVGDENFLLGHLLGDLANLRAQVGDTAEALALAYKHIDLLNRLFGPQHPIPALAQSTVVNALRSAGRYAEAERVLRQQVPLLERVYGPGHSATAGVMGKLAETLSDLGRHDEAEGWMRRALALREVALGKDNPLIGAMQAELGLILLRKRAFAETEAALLYGIAIHDRHGIQPGQVDYRRLRSRLVLLYEATGRTADAARYRPPRH